MSNVLHEQSFRTLARQRSKTGTHRFESEELKDGMQDGDKNGGDEQDRVRLRQHMLDLVELRGAAAGRSLLRESLLEGREGLHLEEGRGVEVDAKGELSVHGRETVGVVPGGRQRTTPSR